MVSGEDDIRESLFILFSTLPRERVMLPAYGCSLFPTVFETVNATMLTQARDLIADAILHFEPRIDVATIAFFTDKVLEGILGIEIVYTIIETNTRSNLVFPFYLTEGNNVRAI